MLARLAKADALVDATRPAWQGLGQLGVVVLGVHLAADRLDDLCYQGLLLLPIPVESPESLTVWAAGLALALEFIVVARAFAALALTEHRPERTLRDWWDARSVDAAVLPMFWLVTGLAGAWVVGMAAEDAVAPYAPAAAWPVGAVVAALIAWRLGLSGLARVIAAFDPPKHRLNGVWWAPALVAVATLAAWHGLPIWGLL